MFLYKRVTKERKYINMLIKERHWKLGTACVKRVYVRVKVQSLKEKIFPWPRQGPVVVTMIWKTEKRK